MQNSISLDSKTSVKSPLLRYPSIDLLRGFALFFNVAFHIFTDVFNLNPITSNLFGQPLSVLLIFVAIGYFASYGSYFILISGTGNTISMHGSYQKGKSVKKVIQKQIIGGIILVFFSFLVEGFFQFYAFLGTINGINGHPYDPTRILWHAYAMTPVMCLAVSMIITGIVEFFLTPKEGYKKYNRNILVYTILAILVVILSQPVWDLCKMIAGSGFPTESWGNGLPGDYKMFMPPPDATFFDYFKYFFLAISGGTNHPIFPYLAMSFTGNIIGIILVREKNAPTSDPRVPKKGIFAGFLVFVSGIVLIPVIGVDFGSILPLSSIGDITGINGGLGGYWIPWWCWLLAGQIILTFFILRLIEYRGIGQQVMNKSKFIRRFGMPAFSVYTWHRFIAIPVVLIIKSLAGQPYTGSGEISSAIFEWPLTLLTVALVLLFCGFVLWLWEKVGYIGGIEWMIGSVASLFGKTMEKSKTTQKEGIRWWEHGKMDVQTIFYTPQWIALNGSDELYHTNQKDSALALKLSKIGFFFGLLSVLGFQIGKSSRKTEQVNAKNQQAMKLGKIGIVWMIIVIIALSLISLGTLNLSF